VSTLVFPLPPARREYSSTPASARPPQPPRCEYFSTSASARQLGRPACARACPLPLRCPVAGWPEQTASAYSHGLRKYRPVVAVSTLVPPLPPASREYSGAQGLKKYRPIVAGVDNVENEVDYGEVREHCSVPGCRPPARPHSALMGGACDVLAVPFRAIRGVRGSPVLAI
jgi:hypothetical protein